MEILLNEEKKDFTSTTSLKKNDYLNANVTASVDRDHIYKPFSQSSQHRFSIGDFNDLYLIKLNNHDPLHSQSINFSQS